MLRTKSSGLLCAVIRVMRVRLYVDYQLDAVATDPTVGTSLATQAPLGLGLSPVLRDAAEPVTFDFLKVIQIGTFFWIVHLR